jgi:hypothetical protein
MKKLLALFLALVLTFALAACDKDPNKSAIAHIESLAPATTAPTVTAPVETAKSDQAKAEEVLRAYLKADQITYKDETSYHAADKYLTKEFAAQETKQREEANQYTITKEHKVYVTLDVKSVKLVKNDDFEYVFDIELIEHDFSDELKKEFKMQNLVMQYTVQKQADGTFLVSNKTLTSENSVSK